MDRSLVREIADIFCNIAQKIITKEEPYEKVEPTLELARSLKLYYENESKLTHDVRKMFIPSLTTVTNARIYHSFGLLNQNVAELYPAEKEILLQANRELTHDVKVKTKLCKTSKLEVNEILSTIISDVFPDIIIKTRKMDATIWKCAFKLDKTNNLYLIFDHGTYRAWTDINIGMDNPQFIFDASYLFGGANSYINYEDIELYRKNMSDQMKTLKPIIDSARKSIVEALGTP